MTPRRLAGADPFGEMKRLGPQLNVSPFIRQRRWPRLKAAFHLEPKESLIHLGAARPR